MTSATREQAQEQYAACGIVVKRKLEYVNTLVVVVEGWGRGLLGCMGANLARTPTLDRVAASGMVLDQCFLDSCRLDSQLRSLWTARHALQPCSDAESSSDVWSACEAAGIPACLITDRESVAEQAEQLGCDEAAFLPVDFNDEAAATTDDCTSMQLFYAAAEMASRREGVVWVHSSGLNLPWDAPGELRASFTDPEDPDPPSEVGPPSFTIGPDIDPDEVVGWGQVAAAQSSVIDEGLATLLGAMHGRLEQNDWTVVILGLGGTPLGEHGQIGSCRDAERTVRQSLHGEVLSVPAVLTSPDPKWRMTRRGELFQLPDLGTTIIASSLGRQAEQTLADSFWGKDIWQLPFSDSTSRWPTSLQLAKTSGDNGSWLRCPAWSSLIEGEENRKGESKLFVKPEDRLEISDVADRRPDILEQMLAADKQFEVALQSNQRSKLPALDDELVTLLR